MKDKIKEILESIWVFIQAIGALMVLAFIAFVILLLAFIVIFGAVWCADKLMLGGAIFG